jgi:hypothetical protein
VTQDFEVQYSTLFCLLSFPHVDLSLDFLSFMLLDLVSGCLYLSVSLHRVFLA